MITRFPAIMKRSALVFLASLLLLSLTGCSSTYVDAFNPAMEEFSTAANELSARLDALIADNALFDDPTWQSETGAIVSTFKGAAEALTKLPQPEDEYVKLNDLVQEMASQSMLAADAFNAAFAAQDLAKMNDGSKYLDRVNELLPQINAEMKRLNQ